ncbi:MAG: hypothetical protein CL942_12985 [Desulfovibrio sp.]|nr:hypothetical protein [Desulfovibrio sp.]
MKHPLFILLVLFGLTGCTTFDDFQNAALPQCRTQECARAHGESDPSKVRRTTEPPSWEEAGWFALDVGIDTAIGTILWNNDLPDQTGQRPPDWWDED